MIKNISIKNTIAYGGLFLIVGEQGNINNLGVKISNVNFTDDSETLDNYFGGLVAYNKGKILNCYVEVYIPRVTNYKTRISLTATNAIYIGGLAGYNDGVITNCYTNLEVNATSSLGYCYAGGVVGYNDKGSISGSMAVGNVLSKGITATYSYVGRIAGYLSDYNVTDCYYISTLTLTKYSSTYNPTNDYETKIDVTKIEENLSTLWDETIWNFNYKYPILIKK